MGWETRQRGGRYYTRSRKVGGRVIREYVGAGLMGDLAAQTDELMRERRRLDALDWREERGRLDAIERELATYCQAVGDLAREHLSAAGYHQHARGEWRKRRMAKSQPPAKAPAKANDLDAEALLGRAQRGDKKAWDTLRKTLPDMLGAQWETHFDSPAEAARNELLGAAVGDNYLIRDAWARRSATLQRDLEGPAPTPLERSLCERIATCWLDAQLADMQYGQRSAQSMSFTAGDYYSRRAERAQRRYLDATLALARVRRLLAPIMQQVNIAQPGAQQLNVAAPAQPSIPATPASATPVAPAAQAVAVVTSPTWPPAGRD